MPRRDFVGIYKANKNKSGAVLQVKLANKRDCMFFELAKQVNEMDSSEPYDWKNTKITIKLGENDIGSLLSLFNGTLPLSSEPRKEDLMLYHQNSKGNKVIKFKKQVRGYYMQVSMKEGDRQDRIQLPISWADAELIKVALTRGYEIMLGW